MSKEEEEQIIGRLVCEAKLARKTVALIEANIGDMAQRLGAAATLLCDYYKEIRFETEADKIRAIPTADEVAKALTELRAEKARSQSLQARLKDLEIP